MVAYPTAQTLPLETAVTACRTVLLLPVGFGLGIRVQVLPFQCSIRDCWPVPSLLGPVWPTAQAFESEVIATPSNWPPCADTGYFWIVQALPFQCSISGVVDDGVPGPGPASPTAQA